MRVSLIIVLCLSLIGTACSTRTPSTYSKEEIQENIYLHYYKKLSGLSLKQRMKDSSYSLMRSSYPEFLIDLEHSASGTVYLNSLPHGLAHGDFHPLQTAIRDGIATLEDWDTVEKGPLWRDLVRMESAGRLLAQEEGLRAYPDTPCIDSYAARISGEKQELAPFGPAGLSPEKFPDFSKSPVWMKAESESSIPKDLLAAFKEWIAARPELPFDNSAPMKRLVSGMGSFLKEKIILLDRQQQLWELKEVDTRPGGCDAYEELARVFEKLGPSLGPSPIKSCWVWNNRSFTLIRWSESYWSPSKSDFKSAAELAAHVRWSCSKLADFHQASLGEAEARTWLLAWMSSAPLKTRLKEITDSAFRRYQDGYRLILSEK